MTVILIIIAILLFGFMILIHEFGHFFTAKLCKIKVNEFAIGMGPKLLHKKHGDTEYSLRAFPIGGFCAMEGEDGDDGKPSEDGKTVVHSDGSFSNKPIWKRMLVVVMGAVMNLLLGFILMAIILLQQSAFSSTTISKFDETSKTQQAGIQVGDTITSINGYAILGDRDMSFAFATANPENVCITIKRNGEKIDFNNINMTNEQSENVQNSLRIDFYVEPINKNFFTLIKKTGIDVISTVRMVWSSLAGLVSGQFGLSDVAGPIGTIDMVGKVASESVKNGGFLLGLNNVIYVMMILTVNLGVINLIPFPALDGGKLLLLIIEAVRRKPLKQKYEAWITTAGFAILMGFMVIVAVNDVIRLINGRGIG